MDKNIMKLKSVEITGMHKVIAKKYEFDDISYMIGPNGSGKSTVLEAIQLALLGYIPGYAKTNEGIMKHANGKVMSVEVILVSDDGSEISVFRSWTRSGNSVKAAVSVTPSGYDIENLLSEVELPIYNFEDFKNMTANKLKEWFISFLPNASGKIEWRDKLVEAIGERKILDDAYLEEVLNHIEELSESFEGVQLVQKVNEYLKEEQAFVKGEINRLQGTVSSLIHYDDCEDVDLEELYNRQKELQLTRDLLITWKSSNERQQNIQNQIAAINLPAEVVTSDTSYIALTKAIIDKQEELKELNQQLQDIYAECKTSQDDVARLSAEIRVATAITSDECPYTHCKCDSISAIIEDQKEKVAKLRESYDDASKILQVATEKYNNLQKSINTANNEIRDMQRKQSEIELQYSKMDMLKSQIADIGECPTTSTVQEINAEIADIEDKRIKAAANKKYAELVDTVTAEKFALENRQELLKIWVKLTDANGLQTEIMNKPFEDLAEDMNKYIFKIFGNGEMAANFNLEAKANSFSFGIVRDKRYIEFDCLSSGEKCLYTLALMMCITERSKSALNLILIDDLLDHLDEDNAEKLFKSLSDIHNMQFILAGVKECNIKEICIQI